MPPLARTPPKSAVSSAELERFRSGDPAAFEEVMRAHGALVRATVARFFRGVFEREEAIQEVWIHVYKQRASLDLERSDSFAGWLAVLARRRCIDLLREVARRKGAEGGEAADPLARLELPAEPDLSVQAAELERAVDAFKTKLGAEWRAFFDLHFVEGLDYGEVARHLGISRLRCKYMKKVLAARARKHRILLEALGRYSAGRS